MIPPFRGLVTRVVVALLIALTLGACTISERRTYPDGIESAARGFELACTEPLERLADDLDLLAREIDDPDATASAAFAYTRQRVLTLAHKVATYDVATAVTPAHPGGHETGHVARSRMLHLAATGTKG